MHTNWKNRNKIYDLSFLNLGSSGKLNWTTIAAANGTQRNDQFLIYTYILSKHSFLLIDLCINPKFYIIIFICIVYTCWMTLTRSFMTVRRRLLLVMTAVVRYLKIWEQVVWIAFRYLGQIYFRITLSKFKMKCGSYMYHNFLLKKKDPKTNQKHFKREINTSIYWELYINILWFSYVSILLMVYLQRLVYKHVYDQISAFRVIEEDKQTPMN